MPTYFSRVTPSIEVLEDKPGPRQGKPIQIEIKGPTPQLTDAATQTIKDAISQIPGVMDVEDTLSIPGIGICPPKR